MTSTSKIRVYTNGLVDDGIGAYAYIVLENEDCGEVQIADGKGRMFAPTLLRAKFAQAGKADDDCRMKMRAVYEGVRHCPDGMQVEIYTDNFLLENVFNITKANETDGDIAQKYRTYIAEHGISVLFFITKVYHGRDFPDDDHCEWTWFAHNLCEDVIKRFKKENK